MIHNIQFSGWDFLSKQLVKHPFGIINTNAQDIFSIALATHKLKPYFLD